MTTIHANRERNIADAIIALTRHTNNTATQYELAPLDIIYVLQVVMFQFVKKALKTK